jgi:GTP-binding protein
MIEGYLDSSVRLAGVLSLVDGRREPTDSDRLMIDGLALRGVPTLIVLTKADKVPRARRAPGLDDAARRLGLDPDQVVWFSALTGEGREEVLSAAEVLLEGVEA